MQVNEWEKAPSRAQGLVIAKIHGSWMGPSQVVSPTIGAPQKPRLLGLTIQPKMIRTYITYMGIGTISTRPIPLKFSRLLPSRMGFLSIALCQTRRNPQHLVNRSMGEKNGAVTEILSCQRIALSLNHFSAPINEGRKIEGWHSTARRLSAGAKIHLPNRLLRVPC